tara:strand:+ start:1342 stop:2151 length:810 start_codon:yes stop_codon:yes gene_type:complete
MFQYAAVRGIAAMRGYQFGIPPHDAKRVDNYSLGRAFKLESVGPSNLHVLDRGHAPVVVEKHFHFDEELHRMCPNDVSLFGFFQSEKYFANIKDEILRDFTFHDSILDPCKEMVDSLDQAPLFLHVRRGDPNLVDARGFKWSYTQCSSQHPPQPLSYYEKALKYFDDDQPVVVCSDSPEWVKEQEFFADDRFLISEPQDKYPDGSWEPFVDLCIMSLCSGAIIANSSLSWWGAYLQNNRGTVVAPEMWFGPDYKDKDTSDLYATGWIKT